MSGGELASVLSGLLTNPRWGVKPLIGACSSDRVSAGLCDFLRTQSVTIKEVAAISVLDEFIGQRENLNVPSIEPLLHSGFDERGPKPAQLGAFFNRDNKSPTVK